MLQALIIAAIIIILLWPVNEPLTVSPGAVTSITDPWTGFWVLKETQNKGSLWSKTYIHIDVKEIKKLYSVTIGTMDNIHKASTTFLCKVDKSGILRTPFWDVKLMSPTELLVTGPYTKMKFIKNADVSPNDTPLSMDGLDSRVWNTHRSSDSSHEDFKYDFKTSVRDSIYVIKVHNRNNMVIRTKNGDFTEYNATGEPVATYEHKVHPINEVIVSYVGLVNRDVLS